MKKWFHRQNKWIQRGLLLGSFSIALVAIAMTLILLYALISGPPPLTTEQNTIYYSQDGSVIEEDFGSKRRYWVDLDDISPYIIQATLTSEDRHFYDHSGFDMKRIGAAVLKNIRNLAKVEGASTITQQYARNLYLSHEKTWVRKTKEAIYALRLEMFYDKDEILAGYLNSIYYGHGAYGIEAASRYFFDKHANELSLSESAMLAGIPKGPSYYSPFNNEENANDRQKQILASMEAAGHIDASKSALASQEKLAYHEPNKEDAPDIAPYFQDAVAVEAMNRLDIDREQLTVGGYHIYTTLDIPTQKVLEKSMEQHIDKNSEIQAAGIVIAPETGSIQALAGGRNYETSSFNRVTQAKRMVGSTIKPFLYYEALGSGFTPTTQLVSKPTKFELGNGEVYAPSNFDGYYANEPITMAQALALSDNIYAVKTNVYLGPERLKETLGKFGISGKIPAVPSLALGTATLSLYDMTKAYSKLARPEEENVPHTITKITDSHGNMLYEYEPPDNESMIDPKRAFLTAHMMTGMFDSSLDGYMRVTGSSIAGKLSRPYSGKSGTTNTDSWMIGFSPELVTGIWTGYDQGKQITRTSELQYSKDIWADVMEQSHQDRTFSTLKAPEGVVGVYVDPATGLRATPYCDTQRLMYFEEDKIPESFCTEHTFEENRQPREKEKNKGGWKDLLEWLF
ncbi:penicillin-binding protein 2D [Thalassobacillus devorans]|uniref:Penicillin-binding protein 2D n=1 Tax=Thalassobacillus devorans TaxID=279813 RepID=A0ABQ1NWT8_9BACI|nr:PBP1A family penicillin-binding protein [Thalassobacillus devorans]NIK28423.1 1A family penicillin-binding protein [Thalassobacillus devorans]GGC86369.1 penicillin-binding protein 2D [Thalassobacillus devorans]